MYMQLVFSPSPTHTYTHTPALPHSPLLHTNFRHFYSLFLLLSLLRKKLLYTFFSSSHTQKFIIFMHISTSNVAKKICILSKDKPTTIFSLYNNIFKLWNKQLLKLEYECAYNNNHHNVTKYILVTWLILYVCIS